MTLLGNGKHVTETDFHDIGRFYSKKCKGMRCRIIRVKQYVTTSASVRFRNVEKTKENTRVFLGKPASLGIMMGMRNEASLTYGMGDEGGMARPGVRRKDGMRCRIVQLGRSVPKCQTLNRRRMRRTSALLSLSIGSWDGIVRFTCQPTCSQLVKKVSGVGTGGELAGSSLGLGRGEK